MICFRNGVAVMPPLIAISSMGHTSCTLILVRAAMIIAEVSVTWSYYRNSWYCRHIWEQNSAKRSAWCAALSFRFSWLALDTAIYRLASKSTSVVNTMPWHKK